MSPYKISIESNKKMWFKCENVDYHPEYEMRAYDFKNNHRCPYCVGRKTCKIDSFGQWAIDNIDKDFIKKYWSDKNKISPFSISKRCKTIIYIKCQDCAYHPDYITNPGRFYTGARCPYCTCNRTCYSNSLGKQHPELISCWSQNNNESIYEIPPHSTKKYLWICKEHGEFKSYPHVMIESYYKCPKCAAKKISRYEDMLMKYLDELNIEYKNEWNCNLICINPKTNKRLLYDNEIPNYKLIIEVHGSQHYNKYKRWGLDSTLSEDKINEDYKYLKWKDEYKKQFAINNGYHYLEIPYWNFRTDYYKDVVNKKLEEINNYTPTTTEQENAINMVMQQSALTV